MEDTEERESPSRVPTLPARNAMFVSICPTTEERIAEYPAHNPHEIDALLTRAQTTWLRPLPMERRVSLLLQLADVLEREADALARTAALEMGKPIAQGRAEVRKCAQTCRFFAQEGPVWLRDEPIPFEMPSRKTYTALGPVLAIMPWNFPYWQVVRVLAPALIVGNPVLLKHAPNVTGCAQALEACVHRAGWDQGHLQVVRAEPKHIPALIEDARVAAVTFTGSTQTGRKVASLAGAALKPCVMELGGSDAFVVLADADVPRAATVAAQSRMQNNGQSCIAAKRFLVERPIYPAFLEHVTAALEAYSVGPPLEEATALGPLARADLQDTLHAQVEALQQEGAHLVLGGHLPEGGGHFYPATLLEGVMPSMLPYREEMFGPVASVSEVADIEQAIAWANATPFGLAATVFTNNPAVARHAVAGLRAGSVFVNEMVRSDPRIPFGGMGWSGFGRELAQEGTRAFAHLTSVVNATP